MARPVNLRSFSTYLALFDNDYNLDMFIDFHSLPDYTAWTVRFENPNPPHDPYIGSFDDVYPFNDPWREALPF